MWRLGQGWNSVLGVQNVVPVEERLADATLAERRGQYAAEVRRLIDAAFAVMRTTGDIDPQVRDIVKAAGLSNQAFYRHFASKDALLLAVLADGQRQLVEYLRARVASTADAEAQVRLWIDGMLAQARNPDAAEATRPFAINGARLADRYPDDLAATRADLLTTLAPSVKALGGTDHDAAFVCELTLARMNDAIIQRRSPEPVEVRSLVEFCLAGVRHGT
ncbi:MAG: putative transcriptional regulator, TetR family [Actinomycetia bacterium]|nr:putative transcriptional regulator, TetR family [Actinomycetes bacterium]